MTLWTPRLDPGIDPSALTITKGVFTDPDRAGRMVPWKLYRPQDATHPLPLIVWSHGLGGSRDGAGFLARYLAGQDYAVLHLQHPGTDTSLWEGKPGHPWDVIRAAHIPRRAVIDRYKDIPFALAAFLTSPHGSLVDPHRIGMSGHSFGALTTQIMLGQRVMRAGSERSYRYPLPVFRAGILYSPVPKHRTDDQAAFLYQPIDRPVLHMTGTHDDSPLEEFGYHERRAVFTHAGGPDQALMVLTDGDHMVYNGSRGQLGDNPARGEQERLIKLFSAAWWDWHLKDDARARDYFKAHPAKTIEDGYVLETGPSAQAAGSSSALR